MGAVYPKPRRADMTDGPAVAVVEGALALSGSSIVGKSGLVIAPTGPGIGHVGTGV